MFFSKEVLFVPVTSFVIVWISVPTYCPWEGNSKAQAGGVPTKITLEEMENPDSLFLNFHIII